MAKTITALFTELNKVNPEFAELLLDMARTHVSKGHDYAKRGRPFYNFERAAEFAQVSVNTVFDVLIAVKQARLETLISEGKDPLNKSSEDTFLDRAVYATLAAAYYRLQVMKGVIRIVQPI